MISRVDVTRDLSEAVLKRLRREFTLVAQEVWVDDVHRVDFVGFKPFPMVSYPASLERGTFVFVEVKSCMDDYKSGHGLTFDGDVNWLVCTQELRDQLGYRIDALPQQSRRAYQGHRGRRSSKLPQGIGFGAAVANGEPQRGVLAYEQGGVL